MSSSPKVVEEIVGKALATIMEHCETAQIFVTLDEGDGVTGDYYEGAGNWYARSGQVREWLVARDAEVRKFVNKSKT